MSDSLAGCRVRTQVCPSKVGLFSSSLEDHLGEPSRISKTAFLQLRNDSGVKRICFGTTHSEALREWPNSSKYPYKLTLPFQKTIGPLLTKATGVKLLNGQHGPYCGLWESEATKVREWMIEQGDRVFLRDNLDLSLALSPYLSATGLTRIGRLEQAAKERKDSGAVKELVQLMTLAVRKIPFYSDADLVTCVPPRRDKDFDLPTYISERVARSTEKPFVKAGAWLGDKGQLKDVSLANKWQRLEAAHFSVTETDLNGKNVVVLDDLYQSGCTLHFVAAALKSKGAKRVYGLAIVKSGRDTDNQ